MKVAPTLEGGLRIDPETPGDWHILRSILLDANGHETDLASRLGDLVTDERLAEDWQDYVVPDLRESFSDDLNQIQAAIETAAAFPNEGESPIWVIREDAFSWYSALNQARLALEEEYGFGPDPDSAQLSPIGQEAFSRSQFYCVLQTFLLRHSL